MLSLGFSATEIYHAGLREVQDFVRAGFSSARLASVFPLEQLAGTGGLSYAELKCAGINDLDLIKAGFVADVEKQALMKFFEKTNGNHWRVKMHWGSNKPIKQWYGIAVQTDNKQIARVISIDLVDNNLSGSLPEELSNLLCLRRLRLTRNPALDLADLSDNLLRLIHQNKIVNDIVPYNSAQKLLARKFQHGFGSLLWSQNADPNNTSGDVYNAVNGLAIDIPPATPVMVNMHPSSQPQGMQSLHHMFALPVEESAETERDALLEIFKSLHGIKWKNHSNWCTSTPIGSWFGVTVNTEGLVVALQLPSNNLKGHIPDSIGSLQCLELLDLRLNQISGFIPQGIAYCFALQKVYLQMNKLCGAIPNVIQELTELVIFDVRSNLLQGEVPYEVFECLQKLKYLGLYSNHILVRKDQLQSIIPTCKIVW